MSEEIILSLRLVPAVGPADDSEQQMRTLLQMYLAQFELREMEIATPGTPAKRGKNDDQNETTG